MLSPEQVNDIVVEWGVTPARDKAEIIAEFMDEHGSEPGWETWLLFLQERLNISGYWEPVGLA